MRREALALFLGALCLAGCGGAASAAATDGGAVADGGAASDGGVVGGRGAVQDALCLLFPNIFSAS